MRLRLQSKSKEVVTIVMGFLLAVLALTASGRVEQAPESQGRPIANDSLMALGLRVAPSPAVCRQQMRHSMGAPQVLPALAGAGLMREAGQHLRIGAHIQVRAARPTILPTAMAAAPAYIHQF